MIIEKLEEQLSKMINGIANYGPSGPNISPPRCPQQAYYLGKLIGAMKSE